MAIGVTGSARNALTWKRNVASIASSATSVICYKCHLGPVLDFGNLIYSPSWQSFFFFIGLVVNSATCFQLLNMTSWVRTACEKKSHPVGNKSFWSRWRIHGKFPESRIASLVQMSSARPKCCSALPKPSSLDGIASVCHFLYRMLSASLSAMLCPNIRHSAALKESSWAMSAWCHLADAVNGWTLGYGLSCLRHVCEVVWFTVWRKNLYIRSDLEVLCIVRYVSNWLFKRVTCCLRQSRLCY